MAGLFRRRSFRFFLFALLLLLTITGILLTEVHYTELDIQRARIAVLDCVGMALSLVLLLSLLRGKQERVEDVWFRLLLDVNIVYLFADGVFWLIDGCPELRVINLILNTLYCALPILLSWLFWNFLRAWGDSVEYKFASASLIRAAAVSKLVDLTAVTGVLFVLGNLKWGYLFIVHADTGKYERGPWTEYLFLFSTVILIVCGFRIIFTKMPLHEKLTLLIYPLLPYVNTVMSLDYTGPTMLAFLTFCSLFFFYTNLYLRRREELEVQRENYIQQRRELLIQKEKLAVSEKELMESRMNGMLLQISPHFIYNTLGSIDSLCEEDAAQAQQLIRKFSQYLKNNYQDLTREPLIPFKEELEHLRLYLSIEEVRFPNLCVEYDIKAEDFRIPSQSIQPLVENAVRHGIGRRRHSEGTLVVRTEENDKEWVVTIEDNGAGFPEEVDADAADLQFSDDSMRHIGIGNVAKRIDMLCAGSLHIKSRPGEGTVCTMHLPKTAMEERKE